MGLDMYLYAEITVPRDSSLGLLIEQNLSDEQRRSLDPKGKDYEPYAYLSGWEWQGEPDKLYRMLCEELKVTPASDSPHMDLYPGSAAWRIDPCILYWRKANAIHRWFVERCQDEVDECQRTLVHPEMLMELLNKCRAVAGDHGRAPAELPTQSGFFFGPTEYDEWYFQDIESTIAELPKQMKAVPRGAKFYY